MKKILVLGTGAQGTTVAKRLDEDIREFDDELYNSLKEAKKSFQN